MSFREKSAWISLISTSAIYAIYFWNSRELGGLLGTIVALAVVQTVLTIVVAAFAPKDAEAPLDERERLIDLRATRFAYAALAGSVACACFFGAFNPPIIFKTNALLFLLVIAEILRSGSQVVQYRRGA
jgi:hypothetical protein